MKKITTAAALFAFFALTSTAHAVTLTNAQIAALVSAETTINKNITTLTTAVGLRSVHVINKQDLNMIATLDNEEGNLLTLMTQDGLPPSTIAAEYAVVTNWNALWATLYGSGISEEAVQGQEVALTMAYANLATATSSIPSPGLANLLETNTEVIGYTSAE